MKPREQKPLPEQRMTESAFRWRSRRDFLTLGLGAAAAYGGWLWIRKSPREGEMPWQLRRAMDFNADVSKDVLGEDRLARTFATGHAQPDLRVNGDIGIYTDLDPADWRLQLVGVREPKKYRQYTDNVDAWDFGYEPDAYSGGDSNQSLDGNDTGTKGAATSKTNAQPKQDRAGLLLTLDDLRALPKTQTVTQLKCIEGWSEIAWFGGVRFSDFVAAYPADRTRYIKMATPDGNYYTGMDWESAMHPQTLLAYELNGEPLPLLHGGPLRLATPLKYGYKQLKQIGSLEFVDARPRDYWADNGYDWYAGH